MQQVVPPLSRQLERRNRRFADLLDEHGAALRATLGRMCRDRHEADDVFQETAMRVWKNLDRTPLIRSPRGWLATIAYRVMLDRRSRQAAPAPLHGDTVAWRGPTPAENVERRDAAQRAEELVSGLPEDLRDVAVLHYSGGLSLRETARAMELPLGTVKNRLHQVLSRLREKMQ